MKQVLQGEFQVPHQRTEGASGNTLANARGSSGVLSAGGIRRILSSPTPGTCRGPATRSNPWDSA